MVASTKSVRYLGVDLYQSLDGNYSAENILKESSSRLKFLWSLAKLLNTKSRKLLASALIQCHFDCACSAWFIGLEKIYLQKPTIRFVAPQERYLIIQDLDTCFGTRKTK